jgi:UDP-glucose 4-epimerase
MQALNLLRAERAAEFINLGTEHGASVREVINMCESVSGKDVPRVEGPRRSGDPAVLIANAAKANNVLQWRPQFDLKSIVETAWKWEKSPRY